MHATAEFLSMTVDNGGIGGSDCGGGYDYNNARGGGVCVACGAN